MADGVSGHHGNSAVSHVEMVYKSDTGNVTILVQNMVVENALAATQIISRAICQSVKVCVSYYTTQNLP